MTYGDIDVVRALSGISITELSNSNLDLIMNVVDTFLDKITGNVRWHWEQFSEDYKEDRFFVMIDYTDIDSFGRVMIDGVELFEFDKDNSVKNSTVSDGDSSNAYPDYWEKGTETNATLTWDTTEAKTESRSLSILKSGDSTAYWNSEVISVNESRPYKLTGWIKTDSITAGTGSGAYLRLTWKDTNETVISSSDGTIVTETNAWTEYSVTAVAPVDAVYAEIRLVHDGDAGTAYFDRFFLSKRNWTGDSTNYTLETTEGQRNKVVQVRYTKTSLPPMIETIANKLSERNALLNVIGGSTTGLSYKFADQQVKRDSLLRQRMKKVEVLDFEVKEFMKLIDLKDMTDWNDFGLADNFEV